MPSALSDTESPVDLSLLMKIVFPMFLINHTDSTWTSCDTTDYGRSVRKSPSLHGRKSNPNAKFLGKVVIL